MDFKELCTADTHEEGAEIRLVNPVTGKDTDCYITVRGMDSPTFRTESRKRQRKALEAVRGNKPMPDDEFGLLVSSTISWRGLESDGVAWTFNKKNVSLLFEKSPLIADQVDKFIADRANFTKG